MCTYIVQHSRDSTHNRPIRSLRILTLAKSRAATSVRNTCRPRAFWKLWRHVFKIWLAINIYGFYISYNITHFLVIYINNKNIEMFRIYYVRMIKLPQYELRHNVFLSLIVCFKALEEHVIVNYLRHVC